MIELVMYGMIPSAKMANWVSAPPEKSLQEAEHAARSACVLELLDAPGSRCPAPACGRRAGRAAIMSRVKRILFRRSGTLKMLRRLASTRVSSGSASRSRAQGGDQRLVSWLPLAGGRRSPHGSGRISTYRRPR